MAGNFPKILTLNFFFCDALNTHTHVSTADINVLIMAFCACDTLPAKAEQKGNSLSHGVPLIQTKTKLKSSAIRLWKSDPFQILLQVPFS